MALKECTSRELLAVRDSLDMCLKVISNACRVRKSALDFSVASYQDMLVDCKTNPSFYYILRFEDKEVTMVMDFWTRHNDGTRQKSDCPVYHFHCENCKLKTLERVSKWCSVNDEFDRSHSDYCNIYNFDVALSMWKKVCYCFTVDVVGLKLQEELF